MLKSQVRASHIRLTLALADEPLTTLASAVQIEHVLVNLVQNAIDAIRDAGTAGGTIRVRTARDSDGMVHVTVQDNGPGFQDRSPEQFFERFFTTKSEGLGMGLAICQAIIQADGGKIWAESPAKGGAAFHFTLPRQA